MVKFFVFVFFAFLTSVGQGSLASWRFCWGSAQVLQKFCRDPGTPQWFCIQRFYGGSVEVLQRFCGGSAEALRRCFGGSAEVLWRSSAEVLPRFCGSCPAGVLRKHFCFCGSSAEAFPLLRKCCGRLLRKCCRGSAEVSAEVLPSFCGSLCGGSAEVLRRLCGGSAEVTVDARKLHILEVRWSQIFSAR